MVLGYRIRTIYLPTRSELAPLFIHRWLKLASGDLCGGVPLPKAVPTGLAFVAHRMLCGLQV